MDNTSQRTESVTKAMLYWLFSVIGTFFPTLASIVAALAMRKERMTLGGEEFVMLACLMILPTLLDYFRYSGQRKIFHDIFFYILLLLFALFMMLYGIDKAADSGSEIIIFLKVNGKITFFPASGNGMKVPLIIAGVSAAFTSLAEYALHRSGKGGS